MKRKKRARLHEMDRLVVEIQRALGTRSSTLIDYLKTARFQKVVPSVWVVAGFDHKNKIPTSISWNQSRAHHTLVKTALASGCTYGVRVLA